VRLYRLGGRLRGGDGIDPRADRGGDVAEVRDGTVDLLEGGAQLRGNLRVAHSRGIEDRDQVVQRAEDAGLAGGRHSELVARCGGAVQRHLDPIEGDRAAVGIGTRGYRCTAAVGDGVLRRAGEGNGVCVRYPRAGVRDRAGTYRRAAAVGRRRGSGEGPIAARDVHEDGGARVSGGDALIGAYLYLAHQIGAAVGYAAVGLREGRRAGGGPGEEVVAVAVLA